MPSAIWERLRPATFDAELPYVAAEEVLDIYSGPLCAVGVAPPPGVFTLSGKVTDSATAKAIAGVLITLATKTATTNQDGNYSFANLEAKTYHAVFAKEGYTSFTRDIAITKDTVLNIQMTPVGVPPEEKKFPWWTLGVAAGAIVVVAVAATAKKKEVKK